MSDPEARARYDSIRYESEAQKGTKPPEPVTCSKCGKIAAQARYAVYRYVVSVLITAIRNPIQGVFCSDCGRKAALKASAITAVAGWWSIPWGPIYTVIDITRNAIGGYQPPGVKERLLWINALAFTSAGQLRLAYALAREARKSTEEEIANSAGKLMEILSGGGVKEVPLLRDKWKRSPAQILPHIALMLVIPVALFFLSRTTTLSTAVDTPSWQTKGSPPDIAMITTEKTPFLDPTNLCLSAPANGAVLADSVGWIEKANALEIQNGSNGDAIIKIRNNQTGRLLLSFIVKKNMTATYEDIPDGSYRIQYAFGDALDADCTNFVRLQGAGEFPGDNTFTITDDGASRQRTRLTFTLYPVPNGDVQPNTIAANQFNAD